MQKLLIGIALVLAVATGMLWSGAGRGQQAGQIKEIVIQRSSDGHFYTDVSLNGHSVRFLIDTGAGAVALTQEDAALAGIKVDSDEFGAIGEGASGLVRGKFVELDTMKIGDFAPQDVKAAVVEGASVSLLGQPFLDQLDEIVIREDEMILRYS